MRRNSLSWFAVGFACAALINSIVVGYFGLHSHDEFLKLDGNEPITNMPWDDSGTIEWLSDDNSIIYSLPASGGVKKGDVLQKDGFGGLIWKLDGIIHSEAYDSYPAEVLFEQGMTLFPGESATVTLPFIFSDTTYALFEDIKIDSTK